MACNLHLNNQQMCKSAKNFEPLFLNEAPLSQTLMSSSQFSTIASVYMKDATGRRRGGESWV